MPINSRIILPSTCTSKFQERNKGYIEQYGRKKGSRRLVQAVLIVMTHDDDRVFGESSAGSVDNVPAQMHALLSLC